MPVPVSYGWMGRRPRPGQVALLSMCRTLSELNAQLGQHPSMLPNDFDIDVAGNLVLSLNGGEVMYDFEDQQSISATRSPTSHSAPGSPNKSAGVEQRPQSQNSKT
ncbi:patj homolog [Drosophila pseudoobscura]|uniref:Patj homolog n=1 Tax=Drosophila pseudoobscura pseudoobscura TaxID=46245 RepID=A0A6I8WDE9_DROPS|nr:patj homolog [Drosophila pseudoobscura]